MPYTESQKIVAQALSFQTPDRLPVFDGHVWSEFIENWREVHGLPAEAEFEKYFPVDLCSIRASEQFFSTRIGEVRMEGDYIFRDDGCGGVERPGIEKTAYFDNFMGNFSCLADKVV